MSTIDRNGVRHRPEYASEAVHGARSGSPVVVVARLLPQSRLVAIGGRDVVQPLKDLPGDLALRALLFA